MKTGKLKKYIRSAIFVVIGCYISAVIISSAMMSQMTQITYNATAYGTTLREDIVDFKTNTVQRNYYDYYGNPTGHKENLINPTKEFGIKCVCSFSLLPLWRKNYFNLLIMDGDQYNIVRSYKESENVIYGSNAYPLTYWFVLQAIDNTLK
ncbi:MULTISPECIES: hypothetical protein [unclassified Sedimentibacter]|uniref:hypothetical protein n=1 Tax=unclassified Sedimentibacter TaxID=2649220 RepID=UPI0027DFA6B4|nr:hypothetical protein [Sedimentibacter sp. MB35-C1]WMJ77528.1 hypothetical protein RBQ61_00950 [Sedimentibacter sp. MB35-C1]